MFDKSRQYYPPKLKFIIDIANKNGKEAKKMLIIEAHHLVIGRFCAKAITLSCQGVASKNKLVGRKSSSSTI